MSVMACPNVVAIVDGFFSLSEFDRMGGRFCGTLGAGLVALGLLDMEGMGMEGTGMGAAGCVCGTQV